MGRIECEYDYRPRWTLIVFIAAFFGLSAVVLGSKAANNDRGVVISHAVELGPDGATALYWVLTAGSVGFVAGAALLVYHRAAYRQRIAFGPAALVVPASRWSRGETEIAYRGIVSLSEATINGQRYLCVTHAGGEYLINASMLPSRVAFAEIGERLAAKVREARTAE